MNLRVRGPWLLVTGMLAAACGSRSNLPADGSVAAGGGGATSSTTTTITTGTGGAGATSTGGAGGGSPVECAALEVLTPPASLEGLSGYHQLHPVWTLSSDDGEQVTLLFSLQTAEGPEGPFPISLSHTTLKPWVDFPSGGVLGPVATLDFEGGRTFAAGQAAGDRFAALFTNTVPPGIGLQFSNAVVPYENTAPPAVLASGGADEALFAVQGPGGHLLGMQFAGVSGGPAFLVSARLAAADGSFGEYLDLGCASDSMHADAVRSGGGFLVALSTGASPGGADCSDPAGGWPDDVQIVRTDGAGVTFTDHLGAPGSATDVKMAPRSDGAWVVLGTPPGQVVNGMFLGARLDLEGKVAAMFPVGGGDQTWEIPQNGTLTAAAVGDNLAVAWVDFGGDKGPFLNVKVFDPGGAPTAQAQLFFGGSPAGAPALLGSPSGGHLLLAWAETPAQGGDGEMIQAVRIDCVTGL